MATVAMQRINGSALRSAYDKDERRSEARKAQPDVREVASSPRHADFPRSASYTYLPEAKDHARYNNQAVFTIKGSFSDADLVPPPDDLLDDITPPDSSGWTTPDDVEQRVPVQQTRDLVAELQRSPKISVQRMARGGEDDSSSIDSSARPPSIASTVESVRTTSTPGTTPGSVTPRPRATPNDSFSRRFNRNSWYGASQSSSSPSRSPSPPKPTSRSASPKIDIIAPPPAAVTTPRRKSFSKIREAIVPAAEITRTKSSTTSSDDQKSERPRPPSRRSTLFRRKSRPGSGIFGSKKENESSSAVPASNDAPPVPRMPSLPKSFSTDRLPTFRSHTPQLDRAAPVPRLLSTERAPSSGLSIPIRRRDELWNVFRGLDGDYTKFASKSVALKANVVRSTLLPFLRTYLSHASNHTLRPEDLDRRANILNKWWTGLIEMLHGRNNQSISGTDRPAILDGISGIMERPEWRLAPSPFCPLDQKMKGINTPRNRSNTSLSSGASEFLTESVHHNVRNIFIQNLSAQMAFVVDKMSLRNASASLVTFCGKACAYAFMFVPGMADVLTRLWDLQMDTLRRVLEGNDIGKFDNLGDLSASVSSSFPPALHQLGFTSLMKYMRKLRRESDLFYVFVKHFHILVTEFLPKDFSKQERACAPGVLLVHAQILANLDATIHRDAGHAQRDPAAAGQSPTFDDVLGEPDAVASLPLPPTNAVRIMAENRLIMLIRDFLSERTADHPIARDFFADAFNDLMQTAAKGTSIYDHAACYTLLDFLEEALVILVRFEHLKDSDGKIINSEFWQSVCRKMIESQNTMTEIRLYAFLYTIWNTVVCNTNRKADLCLGLLLDPEVFESRFNHWCPMVRAYYMRLLCWRVTRFDGESHSGDMAILETALQRLRTTWSHYLYLREQAVTKNGLLPPTNPCNPAPGRRLLIIRTDTQVNPGGSFLSFDGLTSPTPPTQPQLPNKRFSTLSRVVELDSRPETSHSSSDSEIAELPDSGFGGFFRKMMGTSKTRSKSQGPPTKRIEAPASKANPTPPAERANGLTRAATDEFHPPRSSSIASSVAPSIAEQAAKPPTPATPHRNFSFKFSLEYHPNNKPAPGPLRLLPPRLPMPAQKHIQEESAITAFMAQVRPVEPTGASAAHARYSGRALAEWMVIVGECQSFFERRKNEGVPGNRFVETPTLGVEVFRRPA
ncbi:hypothetical protein LTR78_000880 [Recurvomyces mirabilis]|uniref:DUF1765-domain-containing protein n=1 Tax=Recurvomyces mirabilis TaxID=574656 RepID=A0AAE0WWJ3_9PEZI|nr:hypothetical protein LTR78_000880 [Recurvomyces mirabilis]KAK5158851.1 hypothetical protein LTS14_002959 [Recurvomyces mirabilis]